MCVEFVCVVWLDWDGCIFMIWVLVYFGGFLVCIEFVVMELFSVKNWLILVVDFGVFGYVGSWCWCVKVVLCENWFIIFIKKMDILL